MTPNLRDQEQHATHTHSTAEVEVETASKYVSVHRRAGKSTIDPFMTGNVRYTLERSPLCFLS